MDAPLFLGAFVAGLAGSPHCALMCGPFASACARSGAGLAAWHAGRLSAYALLGAVAGAAGSAMPGPAWLPAAFAAAFLLWFAGGLAGLLPEPRLAFPGLTRSGALLQPDRGAGARYLFGIVNGFLPCGLVYAALGLPVALAAPLPGALAMVVFGAGTLPLLSVAALGLRRMTPAGLIARRVVAAVVLLIGLWSIGTRSGLLGRSAHTEHGGRGAAGHGVP
jgi:sulfite exporter TauE/SafE